MLEGVVSGLSYVGGTTNTADGLRLLRTQIFNVSNGDRLSVPDIAFVITDGQSNVNSSDTIPEVSDSNIFCFCISVICCLKYFLKFASPSVNRNVFSLLGWPNVTDFSNCTQFYVCFSQ